MRSVRPGLQGPQNLHVQCIRSDRLPGLNLKRPLPAATVISFLCLIAGPIPNSALGLESISANWDALAKPQTLAHLLVRSQIRPPELVGFSQGLLSVSKGRHP